MGAERNHSQMRAPGRAGRRGTGVALALPIATFLLGLWVGSVSKPGVSAEYASETDPQPSQAEVGESAEADRAEPGGDEPSAHWNWAARVPAFVPPEPAVQTNPSAANYDPVRLVEVMGDIEIIQDIFAAEARTEPWAREMEAAVRGRLMAELAARAQGSTIAALDCKTLTCKLAVRVGSEDANDSARKDAAVHVLQGPRLSDETVFTSDPTAGPDVITAYLGFRPRRRSVANWAAWYDEQKQASIRRQQGSAGGPESQPAKTSARSSE